MVWGVKRGLFSNEAGMGSAPNAAAAADVSHPGKTGTGAGYFRIHRYDYYLLLRLYLSYSAQVSTKWAAVWTEFL